MLHLNRLTHSSYFAHKDQKRIRRLGSGIVICEGENREVKDASFNKKNGPGPKQIHHPKGVNPLLRLIFLPKGDSKLQRREPKLRVPIQSTPRENEFVPPQSSPGGVDATPTRRCRNSEGNPCKGDPTESTLRQWREEEESWESVDTVSSMTKASGVLEREYCEGVLDEGRGSIAVVRKGIVESRTRTPVHIRTMAVA
ncbi:hypothetical protein E2542_SST08015 [Spatholobus suberectus]|nr:hypothetical protein E2542_SST08015 [Spatholobus suberectus]